MSQLDSVIQDLVCSNRILAAEHVVDAFGHVSARHPDNQERYLLARARAPELIDPDDIMEFTLGCEPIEARGRTPYIERFIHGAIYEARTDIHAVVHSHSLSVIPFGVSEEKLQPIMHMCAPIGHEVPIWDPQTNFGDTDMLVRNIELGRDLARFLGSATSVLMRGHGSVVVGQSVRKATFTAIYLEVNANLQERASRHGKIKFLTSGEIEQIVQRFNHGQSGAGYDRAWEYWCQHAGVPYHPLP
jgi:ribulose-5-phosphate 4-epimerase/fuculose-1-phosphate aldolase